MYQRRAYRSAVQFAALAGGFAAWLGTAAAESPGDAGRNRRLPDKLVAFYPDFLASHDEITFVWKDGTAMIFDGGKREKDFETRLDHPDLEDELAAQARHPVSTSIRGVCAMSRSSPRCTETARRAR